MEKLKVWLILMSCIIIFMFVCITKYPTKNATKEVNLYRNVNMFKQLNLAADVKRLTADYQYVADIKTDCGKLCDTSSKGTVGPFFDHITSPINCKALYSNPYIDMGHNFEHAPRQIPEQLLKYYNMDGRLPIKSLYYDKPYLGGLAYSSNWTKQDIDKQIELARKGQLRGTYGISETNALRDGLQHTPGIKGGRVLVIGSERPWVEACVLEAGASKVVTLEYGKINSGHQSIQTMVPNEFSKKYLNGTLGLFDAIVTFSSIEHSGLGRYGDALNPWGDIIAIAKAWCVTKPNGGLAIGVMFNGMRDYIDYNAHRVYGSLRYPYLTTNWKQVYKGKGKQKVFVFSKASSDVKNLTADYQYVAHIKTDCGKLCNTSRKGTAGPFFDHITSPINCKALYTNPYIDMGHNFEHAPRQIPDQLLKYYNMDGRLPIKSLYYDKPYLGGMAYSSNWTKQDIDKQIELARKGQLRGTYGISETNALRDGLQHTPGIKGGRVLVIGSERPWVEACVLEAGASKVVTLEYGKINSGHQSIQTMVPNEFSKKYLNGTLGLFDAIVTFSSIEHSGLGRYGDALNPWGDIIAIAKAWCVTKPNGGLAIGVMFNGMRDYIDYNAHRVYGSLRYPYLTTNWKQVYKGKGKQKVFVFSKASSDVKNLTADYQYVAHIKTDCGKLCNTSRKGTAGPFFDHITSPINCKALYTNPYIDMGHNFEHAPRQIPDQLLKYYNMDGRLPIKSLYYDKPYLGGMAYSSNWTKQDIDKQIELARKGQLRGTYGISETNALRDGLQHTPGIKGGRVLVIGSERPWVEACVLEAGASKVVTLEYGKINSGHQSIQTMVPNEFSKKYLNGTLGLFDAIVTFSSIEHSGLGRYGDALNPWGDIIAIAKAWCVTKPNGGLAIGVMFNGMRDYIAYNAHRVYGSLRYPYLTTNWKQVYKGKGGQKVFVFSKVSSEPE